MTPSDHSDALPSRRELRRRRAQQAEDTATTPLVQSEPESTEAPEASGARRAANTPVDAPSTTASQTVVGSAEHHPRRRSRRADAEVSSHPQDASTATSSIPIVAPREADNADRPLTRRELRERRRLDAGSALEPGEPRDEDAHQGSAPSDDAPVWDESGLTSTQSFKVAMGISDTGMLNSIDAEREAIAREATALNQKIQEHGASNPHHIDPELLREQQALAERARELAVRHQSEEFDDADLAPAGDAPGPEDTPDPVADQVVEADTAVEDISDDESAPLAAPSARRRRSDVEQTRSSAVPPDRTEAPSNEPIGAQTAHGLDPLDTREWTSRERTYMTVSAMVFAIGIITLIIGLVLMLR